MCQRVNCDKCGKVTYQGCGMHLDQVYAGVPEERRCKCEKPQPKGLWQSLFGG